MHFRMMNESVLDGEYMYIYTIHICNIVFHLHMHNIYIYISIYMT